MIRGLGRVLDAGLLEDLPRTPRAGERVQALAVDGSSTADPSRPISRWAVWSLAVGGTLAILWPILPELWRIWLGDSDNSHGLLVPAVSAVVIWSRRERLRALEVRPSPWGFLLAGFAFLLYLVALRVDLALPARTALPLAIVGLLWANLGTATLRALAFPLAFLGLMVPIPQSLSGLVAFPLQRFAAAVSAYILTLGRMPVLREGNMLYFSTAALEVAEACSGVRSMASYAILGILFAYLGRDRLSALQRALLVAATTPLALAVNILRVTGTGLLATHIGSRAAQGFLHEFSGFVVFALGFLLLWGLTACFARCHRSSLPAEAQRFAGHSGSA